MEPEISRRCSVCGATIRRRAAFCPQCGQVVSPQGEKGVDETQALEPPAQTHTESAQTVALDSQIESRRKAQVASPSPEAQKATPAQPRVENNVRARVEKIRHASHVVLDQAAYDPSVRFLLIAAGFFVLFLVLLIFNKLLG